MRLTYRIFFAFLFNALGYFSYSQTIPIGTPLIEETWRRMQITGEQDSNISFTVRPITNTANVNSDTVYDQSSFSAINRHSFLSFAKGKGKIFLLPITLRQQFNSHHPFGWNEGSMIQARGYQNQLSMGLFSKIGPLSIQFQPEVVYAQNKSFSSFPASHNDTMWKSYYSTIINMIDEPERFGNDYYFKLFPGQSNVRLNYKKLSFGISTENLWWGPGIRNSLIMSNNAPGFQHLTFNTTSPVISRIGTFEWQVISGLLKNSEILPIDTMRNFDGQSLYNAKIEDDRYLNGMIITWQPKWMKGLFLGFARVFYQYQTDIGKSLNGYFPIAGNFFKGNKGDEEDAKKRDQMLSIFFRLLLPKEKAEIYAEFGRNDHSQNLNDLLLEPEHARAYIIGAKKMFDINKKSIEVLTEFTNLQIPTTGLVREQNSWYSHYQVRHGYTNRGQVIGAGIGTGSSSQTVAINWIKKIDKFGIMLERVVRNNDFYYNVFTPTRNFKSHWVDLSLNLNKSWHRNHFMYNANISLIRSLNYQWRKGEGKDVNNLHAGLSVSYLF